MRFRSHLLSSLAAGLAIYPRRPLRLAALLAAGTLIDLDHLLLYSLQTGDWSVVGALRYDRYRNRGAGAGDNRPRYGPLRSWLHRPLLVLPLCWAAARQRTALRPLALGLSLHLILDHPDWPARARERLSSRGVCRRCGRPGRRVEIVRVRGQGPARYRALCRRCAEDLAHERRRGDGIVRPAGAGRSARRPVVH